MTERNPFKIGISIGLVRGQRMFQTDIEAPSHSFHAANQFIHDKFDDRFSLYFVDEQNRGRRRSRRRG
jgi:hypothetical protein